MKDFIRRVVGTGLAILLAGAAWSADERPAAKAKGATGPASSIAQQPDIRSVGDSNSVAMLVKDAWQRRVPDLNWENLPLGEIVRQLREHFPEINFIFKNQSDSADAVDLNGIAIRLILRAATLSEILKAIELAADRPIQITGLQERMVVFERKPMPLAVDASGLPVPVPAQQLSTRVFSVRKYLENRSEKETAAALAELEDVILKAGALMNDASNGERKFNPRLSLHSGTKLLIVVGYPGELALVENIVNQLPNSPTSGTVLSNSEREPKPKPAPAGSQ